MSTRPRYYRDRVKELRRDGVCHLCGVSIDPRLPPLHPGAFSVDHLKPTSLGGPKHDPSNVAPAHRACNTARGTDDHRNFVCDIPADVVNPDGYDILDARARIEAALGFDAETIRYVYSHQPRPSPYFFALRRRIDARVLELRESGRIGPNELARAVGLPTSKKGRGRRRCMALVRACRRAREARDMGRPYSRPAAI